MTTADRLFEIIDRFAGARVALVGDLVLDRFILGTPKRISREAPVIILRHEGQLDVPGGGANALANLAALGVTTVPVGVVGDDEPGRALVSALENREVDTSSIVAVPDYRTPTKVRILGGGSSSLKHQVARYDVEDELPPGGEWREQVGARLETACANADAVAISDYGYGAVAEDTVGRIVRGANRPRWVCADSRFRIDVLRGVDAATPNLQELEESAGKRLDEDPEVAAAADSLRQALEARFVLATRGNRGMTLVEEGLDPLHLPVYGTDEVADVTGAGDTVLAVLSAALAAGATPADAARLANYGGGIVVMKLGTATLGPDELREAVRRDLGEPPR
jgi:rfaE bifunctional protein kinase chain/domain